MGNLKQQSHGLWLNVKLLSSFVSDLAETLCTITCATDVHSMLCGKDESISGSKSDCSPSLPGCFVDVLNILKPSLTRDTWKQEPCSRHAFYSCLINVEVGIWIIMQFHQTYNANLQCQSRV